MTPRPTKYPSAMTTPPKLNCNSHPFGIKDGVKDAAKNKRPSSKGMIVRPILLKMRIASLYRVSWVC